MPRIWVQIGRKIYCCTSVSSTCHTAQLTIASTDKQIVAATGSINETLKEVQGQAEPGQELVFITVTNAEGEDALALVWAYVDEEVTTYEDKESVYG